LFPVYYINLASAPRRRTFLEDQLNALGLPFERIEAVTPADLSQGELARYCSAQSRHWLTPIELACAKSHVSTWSRLVSSGARHAVILEDDAVLSSYFASALDWIGSIESIPDLVQLLTALAPLRLEREPLASSGTLSLFRAFGVGGGGTAAYLISAAAAKKQMARSDLYARPIDHSLFQSRFKSAAPEFVQCLPAIAVQSDLLPGASAIESSTIKSHFGARMQANRQRLGFRVRDAIQHELVWGSRRIWLDMTGRGKRPIAFLP
jgi:glycosyl transferase, family 25